MKRKCAAVASFPNALDGKGLYRLFDFSRSLKRESVRKTLRMRNRIHLYEKLCTQVPISLKERPWKTWKWAVIYPTLENFNYNFHLPIRHLRSEKKWLATLVISVFTAGLPAKLSRVQLRRHAFRETGPSSLLVSRVANMALLNNTPLSFL